MPSDAAPRKPMTAAEYLSWERVQQSKHEYHSGEVFAMAGGTARHNFLSGAMLAELRTALRGRGCHAMTSDQRVAVVPGERYVYPDVVVVCGGMKSEPEAKEVVTNPSILVEVLSPSTEGYDRGDKWDAYRHLPSLDDYLLVSQHAPRIEHYRREPDGSWRYRVHEAGGAVTLTGGATVSVDAVYESAFELEAG
jgi:Uma2 family endonuclease